MNESIIGQVAEKYGASIPEVNQEIQIAIDITYENPNAALMCVPKKGEVPTPEELIDYCVAEVIKRLS